MQVKEIMTQEVITVERSTKLRELLEMFSRFHIFPLVPVIEEDRRLVGIVSFRNLINVFIPYPPELLKAVPFLDEEKEDIFKADLTKEIGNLVVVEDIMETKFISIQQETSLEEAYKLMKLHLKEEFPVINKEGKLVGMIGIFDIIRRIFRERGII